MEDEKVSARRLDELSKYRPRFDFEQDPSEFYSLVEWYAKVMFPNFEETRKRARTIRRAARRMAKVCSEKEVEAAALVVRRALKIANELDKMHVEMIARHDQVLKFSRFSWDFSDSLECLNGDLLSVLRDMKGVIDKRSRKPS